MSKTIAATAIIIALIAERDRIENTWFAQDGGLTWAAVAAIGVINQCIEEVAVYDRVSIRYVNQMAESLREFCVYPDFY